MPESAVCQGLQGSRLSADDAGKCPVSAHPLEDPLEEIDSAITNAVSTFGNAEREKRNRPYQPARDISRPAVGVHVVRADCTAWSLD